MTTYYNESIDTIIKMNMDTLDFVIIGNDQYVKDQDIIDLSCNKIPAGWMVACP